MLPEKDKKDIENTIGLLTAKIDSIQQELLAIEAKVECTMSKLNSLEVRITDVLQKFADYANTKKSTI